MHLNAHCHFSQLFASTCVRSDINVNKLLTLFKKEDHGTSHVSIIDEDGNAVSVTSTINLWYGLSVIHSFIIYSGAENYFHCITHKYTNNGVPSPIGDLGGLWGWWWGWWWGKRDQQRRIE